MQLRRACSYRVRFLTNHSASGFLARIGTVSYSNSEVFFIFSPLPEDRETTDYAQVLFQNRNYILYIL